MRRAEQYRHDLARLLEYEDPEQPEHEGPAQFEYGDLERPEHVDLPLCLWEAELDLGQQQCDEVVVRNVYSDHLQASWEAFHHTYHST